MYCVGIIPARGGSKSIPRKNVKFFAGRPLLAWTVDAAVRSGVLARVILSTDDEGIATVGRDCGAEVPFLRPPELAQDTTATAPVVQHAVRWFMAHGGPRPEFVVVLEPTSPGRRPWHIRQAVEAFQTQGADSVVSVTTVPHHYVPPKLLRLAPDGTVSGMDGTHPRDMTHRRQDLPVCYAFDGLVFACRTEWVLRDPPTLWGTRVVACPTEPRYSFDLDRPEDWAPAEARMAEILKEEA